MNAYDRLASVYDLFMEEVPYSTWADVVDRLFQQYGVEKGIVAELGCGTGNFTEQLANRGYDMIGIDCSQQMLSMAMQKQQENKNPNRILYLLQDMTAFELYGTVSAMVSVCDSLNYILSKRLLKEVFRLVQLYLDPGGLFLFDLNTIYKYEMVLGNCTIAENRDMGSFIWENFYDREQKRNTYQLTLYLKKMGQNAKANLYERFEEIHQQQAYSIAEVTQLLQETGFTVLEIKEAYSLGLPTEKTERICIVAKENKKRGN